VGKPTAFNWFIIGPGGCPVLPAGMTTSMAEMSPDLAVVLTLPRSKRSASLNGLRSVNRKRFAPSKYSSSFFRSFSSIPAMASFVSVFFKTFMYTSPARFFFNS